MDKDRILAGSRYMFEKWGFHRIAMDDISRHLGISKKTLYKFYVSKDAIVTEYVGQVVSESREALADWMVYGHTEILRLKLFERFLVSTALAANPIQILELRKYHPDANEIVEQFKYELRFRLNIILQQGQTAGIFRNNINTMILAEIRLEELERSISKHQESLLAIQLRQKEFFNLFLHGLLVNGSLT